MIYCLVGMPLAGKSTWARRLQQELQVDMLSTGDYARSLGMGNEGSIRTSDMSERFDAQITEAALQFFSRGSGVIDGFPRSKAQFELMDRVRLLEHVDYRIVFVSANPVVIYERLAKRKLVEGRPEDVDEVVVGRVKRSVEWRAALKELAGGRFFELDESEGYEALKGLICGA